MIVVRADRHIIRESRFGPKAARTCPRIDAMRGIARIVAELPYDLPGKVSNRIINEVRGINRVVYDGSGKPPATIEWE